MGQTNVLSSDKGAYYAYPPRLLHEAEAARYIGMTVAQFRVWPRVPPAVELSPGEKRWDRVDLDNLVDQLKAGERSTDPGDPTADGLPPPPRSVFTPTELAKRWNYSQSTILARFRAGLIPGFKAGSQVRFPIKLILAYERENGVTPTIAPVGATGSESKNANSDSTSTTRRKREANR